MSAKATCRKIPDKIIADDRRTGIWSEVVVVVAASQSPTSPLERDPLSPKSWKNRNSGGIGLAIVTSLDKAGGANCSAKRILGGLNLNPTAPIIVVGGGGAAKTEEGDGVWSEMGWAGENSAMPALDFLNSCYLCGKRLKGRDIYMYRGDKGFCSPECRYQQIVSDECQDKCFPSSMRTSGVSGSPCTGRLFFTGIVTA